MTRARQTRIPLARSFGVATPTLNTAARLSTTRDVDVRYAVNIRLQSLLLGNAIGTVTLQYADDSGMSVNLVNAHVQSNSTSGVLNIDNTNTVALTAIIPANKFRRLVTAITGTVTFTALQGQEVLL